MSAGGGHANAGSIDVERRQATPTSRFDLETRGKTGSRACTDERLIKSANSLPGTIPDMGSQSAAANSARMGLGFDSDRTQQKGRQMPAVVGIGGLGRRLRRAARPHVVQTGNWRRNAIASGRRSASMPAATARSLFTVVSLLVVSGAAVAALAVPVFTVPLIGAAGPIGLRPFRRGDPRFTAHPGNALTDQLLDRGDALRVRRGDHGNGSPGSSGATATPTALRRPSGSSSPTRSGGPTCCPRSTPWPGSASWPAIPTLTAASTGSLTTRSQAACGTPGATVPSVPTATCG